LKLKFQSLRLARKPTGDTTCPPEVRRSKLIYRDIERNADVVGAADSEDEELAILEDTGKLIFKHMSALKFAYNIYEVLYLGNGDQDGNEFENVVGEEVIGEVQLRRCPQARLCPSPYAMHLLLAPSIVAGRLHCGLDTQSRN
jgi:hypothetical protein